MEDIPHDLPHPKGKFVSITAFFNTYNAHDIETRLSVTGVLNFLNKDPIQCCRRCKNTVETSTYISELVAMIIATEFTMAMRYNITIFRFPVDVPALILVDN